MEKVTFIDQTGEKMEMFVLEKTKLSGNDYLLVCDQPEGDAQALILKDISKKTAGGDTPREMNYRIVSDDDELNAVAALFESMLDDVAFVTDDDE
ncbi:MAG: DUF1292 domain-containing protein [Lachnospiraceae bacterium]|nr:DUF1292 domain-containing protein [Lachnospiraceae bacterium]